MSFPFIFVSFYHLIKAMSIQMRSDDLTTLILVIAMKLQSQPLDRIAHLPGKRMLLTNISGNFSADCIGEGF